MKSIRLIFTAITAAAVLAGCGNGFRYVVDGTFSGGSFDGETVYLTTLDDGLLRDSAVVKDGKFQFKGRLGRPMMGELRADTKDNRLICNAVLEKGRISVDIWACKASGTPLNEQLHAFTADPRAAALGNAIDSLISQAHAAATDEELREVQALYDQRYRRYVSYVASAARALYEKNKENTLGAYALNRMVELDDVDYYVLDSLLKHSSPAVAQYLPLRMARARLFYLINTSAGHKYTSVQGTDFATGSPARLKNFVAEGGFTLLDFWASWCGPCREEISENLIRIYNDYKDKGVNVVGVDVWDDSEHLKAAVEKLGIPYPQFVDNSGEAAKIYAITGVPTILLIGRDGTILARDLRGEDIEAALVEAMSAPAPKGDADDNK